MEFGLSAPQIPVRVVHVDEEDLADDANERVEEEKAEEEQDELVQRTIGLIF